MKKVKIRVFLLRQKIITLSTTTFVLPNHDRFSIPVSVYQQMWPIKTCFLRSISKMHLLECMYPHFVFNLSLILGRSTQKWSLWKSIICKLNWKITKKEEFWPNFFFKSVELFKSYDHFKEPKNDKFLVLWKKSKKWHFCIKKLVFNTC